MCFSFADIGDEVSLIPADEDKCSAHDVEIKSTLIDWFQQNSFIIFLLTKCVINTKKKKLNMY